VESEEKMKIRKATKKDAKEILKLFNSDLYLTANDELHYKDYMIEEYLTNPVNKLIVAELNGKVVGTMLAEFWKKAKYVYANDLVVDKKHQRKGIGLQLCNYMEKLAKKQGCNLIFFFTEVKNKKLQKMAKKMKYERGKKFYFYSKEIK